MCARVCVCGGGGALIGNSKGLEEKERTNERVKRQRERESERVKETGNEIREIIPSEITKAKGKPGWRTLHSPLGSTRGEYLKRFPPRRADMISRLDFRICFGCFEYCRSFSGRRERPRILSLHKFRLTHAK